MTTQVEDRSIDPGAAGSEESDSKVARHADIQRFRALAVVLVVAYHAGLPMPGGYVDVDMFFVISGFVISAMLLRQLQHTSRLGFASFYTRRMRRLLPALTVLTPTVALCSAASHVRLVDHERRHFWHD